MKNRSHAKTAREAFPIGLPGRLVLALLVLALLAAPREALADSIRLGPPPVEAPFPSGFETTLGPVPPLAWGLAGEGTPCFGPAGGETFGGTLDDTAAGGFPWWLLAPLLAVPLFFLVGGGGGDDDGIAAYRLPGDRPLHPPGNGPMPHPVPEPATLALVAVGFVALARRRRR